MMGPEAILLLFVFACPGALAVLAWDFFAGVKDRSQFKLVALGLLTSTLLYGVVFSLPCVDVEALLLPDGKTLSLARMVRPGPIAVFLATCLISMACGVGLGRWFHRPDIQAKVHSFSGKTTHAQTWAEVTTSAVNVWVQVEVGNGERWLGYIHRIPVHPSEEDDFLLLAEPSILNEGEWQDVAARFVAIRTSEVRYLIIDVQEDQGDQQEDAPAPAPNPEAQ